MSYNGWKNRQTWNVALHIGNDEQLYRSAVDFMKRYKGARPFKDFVSAKSLATTPDGISYVTGDLDYRALNEMMRELV